MRSPSLVRRDVCPACGGAEAVSVHRSRYDEPPVLDHLRRTYPMARDLAERLRDGVYEVDRCVACGLLFQRWVGTPSFLDVLYDEWLNSGYHPSGDRVYQGAIARPARSRDGHEIFAAAHALGVEPGRLRTLDHGMGWGLWAVVAARLSAESHGWDLSETRRAHAREFGVRTVDPRDYGSLAVDVVNMDQVLEHLSDPAEAVHAAARAVRPGGIVKISVPRMPGARLRFMRPAFTAARGSPRSLLALAPLEHVNCFDRGALDRLAHGAGLLPFPPGIADYLAFLRVPGSVPPGRRDPASPEDTGKKILLKAFARPLYNMASPEILYSWYRKASR